MSTLAGRRATIDRAVNLLDTASPADLAAWLAKTTIHAHLKADPGALRDVLAGNRDTNGGPLFGAWKGAQQLLAAAGQPT